MKKLKDLPVAELAEIKLDCECGKSHSCEINEILIGNTVSNNLPDILLHLGAKKVLIIADNNTYNIAGNKAENMLENSNINFHTYILNSDKKGKHDLVPDERALGSVLAHLENDDNFILGIGSGTINDLCRYISYKTSVPYAILCTAPSMDGYASTVSPLIIDGAKVTLAAGYPSAIIADTDFMINAPHEMLTAGYGDIIGKLTCDADWRLANLLKGEYRCEECAELVSAAVDKCLQNADALSKRDPMAIQYVTEALILSGVAMGLFGNSRPASGAEHHFAHYFEVDALSKGEEHALHGNSVAVGAVISASIYELAKDKLPSRFIPPDKNEVISALKSAGAPTHPKEIGVSKELLHESVLHAMEIRERYTILRFCDENGMLEDIADKITAQFYPE